MSLHVGSVTDGDPLDEAFSDVDSVVHLGARPSSTLSLEDTMATHHANATGTLSMLDAVRRAGGAPLILATSSSV